MKESTRNIIFSIKRVIQERRKILVLLNTLVDRSEIFLWQTVIGDGMKRQIIQNKEIIYLYQCHDDRKFNTSNA